MVRGVGVDIAEVARVRSVIERHGARFTERIFTAGEIAYCAPRAGWAESYAARFAAKEAAFKVLGTGWGQGVSWRDVEVLRDPRGAPRILLSGAARDRALELGIDRMWVSLSHTAEHAVAMVVGEG